MLLVRAYVVQISLVILGASCAKPLPDDGSAGDDSSSSGATETSASASTSTGSTSTTATAADTSGTEDTGTEMLCGNGVIDPGEACDGDVLPEAITCQTKEDFGRGVPGCLEDCSMIDYTVCPLYTECGNEEVAFGEQCDGSNLNGSTCGDFPNLTGRGLACDDDCALDTSACTACREHEEACEPASDVCCDEREICGGMLASKRCCIPGTGDCLP